MTYGRHWTCRSRESLSLPMFKITHVTDAGFTRVIVSGRIAAPQLQDLRLLLEAEHASNLVLDLTEVNLVDVEVVQFLLGCEMQGIPLVGCPGYIREWMVRERRSQ
jgi:hypothetical protein